MGVTRQPVRLAYRGGKSKTAESDCPPKKKRTKKGKAGIRKGGTSGKK